VIKAVFFDWFNTIAHYQPPREELEQQALKELGFTVPLQTVSQGLYLSDKRYYEENARLPIRQRSPDEQAKAYADIQATILTEAGIQPSPEIVMKLILRMRELYRQMKFVLYGDVLPTLQALKAKRLTIALLTNLQREIDNMVRELGIAPYIDFAVTSGEVGADKPQPPIFLKALELAKVKPAEAIHIGDQYQNDVLGARGVGIPALLIDRTDLHPEVTDCPRLKTLMEVVTFLG